MIRFYTYIFKIDNYNFKGEKKLVTLTLGSWKPGSNIIPFSFTNVNKNHCNMNCKVMICKLSRETNKALNFSPLNVVINAGWTSKVWVLVLIGISWAIKWNFLLSLFLRVSNCFNQLTYYCLQRQLLYLFNRENWVSSFCHCIFIKWQTRISPSHADQKAACSCFFFFFLQSPVLDILRKYRKSKKCYSYP